MTDVFISYAHADDKPMSERAKGWVTEFAERLQTAVRMRMKQGGSRVRVWMDQRLEPQKAVDATLAERVGASVCFVAVLSPRYLESDWCRKELDAFVSRVGRGGTGDRVFLAEFLPTERDAWHPAIRSITPVEFWSQPFDQSAAMTLGFPAPDPAGDRPYWTRLMALADFIAGQIGTPVAAPAPSPVMPANTRVWIAQPTDDLLDRWESLAEALRQEGCEILPALPDAYPAHPEPEFRAALEADLSQAQLLVQLLGPHPGRRPRWSAASFSRLQADAARAHAATRGLAHFVWRSPDVRLEDVADADHRALLTGAVAGGFEEFRQQMSKCLARPPAAMPVAAGDRLDSDRSISICISADRPDRALGASVLDLLSDLGVDASLTPEPSAGQTPAQWRQDYESVLTDSHGLVVLYGQAPPSWVQMQVQAAKKTLAQARKGVWGALLDLPPADKPDHGLRMRNLMLLDCRGGLAAGPLERFVSALRNGSHV